MDYRPGRAGVAMRAMTQSRRIMALASISLVVLGTVSTMWGLARTADFVAILLADDQWKEGKTLAPLLQTLDIFLVAAVLFVVGLGLWELFVSDLDLPDWLSIDSLSELKASAGDLIVLVIAIKYVERYAAGGSSLDLLYEAVAVTLVGLMLIAFRSFRAPKATRKD